MRVTESATITSEGQVTIPQKIRELLDLQVGDVLQFVITDDAELTIHLNRDAMDQLRNVRKQLAPLSIDIDDLRHQSKMAWSTVEKRNVG